MTTPSASPAPADLPSSANAPEGKRSRREKRRELRRRTNRRYLALLAVIVIGPLLMPTPPALFVKKAPEPAALPAKVVPVESVRYDNRPAEEHEAVPLIRNRD